METECVGYLPVKALAVAVVGSLNKRVEEREISGWVPANLPSSRDLVKATWKVVYENGRKTKAYAIRYSYLRYSGSKCCASQQQ